MKIGDLVKLSAYGQKVRRTSWVQAGDVGIVTKKVAATNWVPETFFVRWVKSRPTSLRWHDEKYNLRRDLIYAKVKK